VIASRCFVVTARIKFNTFFFASPLDGADMIFDLHAGQDHITLDVNSNENIPASGPTLNLFGCQGEGRQCRS